MPTGEHGGGRREVVGAAVVDDLGRPTVLLAARRTEPSALAGGWEFPGGKVDPGEEHTEALRRELREELGVEVALGELLEGPLRGGWPLGEDFVIWVWWAVVVEGEPDAARGPRRAALAGPRRACMPCRGSLPTCPIVRAAEARLLTGGGEPGRA